MEAVPLEVSLSGDFYFRGPHLIAGGWALQRGPGHGRGRGESEPAIRSRHGHGLICASFVYAPCNELLHLVQPAEEHLSSLFLLFFRMLFAFLWAGISAFTKLSVGTCGFWRLLLSASDQKHA